MYKTKQGTGLKILHPKQMLPRLPIVLAQVKAGLANLLIEIRQVVYSLYQKKKKKKIKKVYNNIIKSIQL